MSRRAITSIAALISLAATLGYLRLLRPWQLRWGASDAEFTRPMPGDAIVEQPSFNATRAVTVHAPPEAIWPWIVQIGVTRAGWYSYDWLDNLGRPSANHIIPELQSIQVGDIIPMSPDGTAGMHVRDFVLNRWMVWWDHQGDSSWAWELSPLDKGSTRLITRVRNRYRWGLSGLIFNLLIEFADIFMMRKCMLGIKQRAETIRE